MAKLGHVLKGVECRSPAGGGGLRSLAPALERQGAGICLAVKERRWGS
jgi:hypothetical protein